MKQVQGFLMQSRRLLPLWMLLWMLLATPLTWGAEVRPRIRELGIRIGQLPPGKLNAITDVAGVKVGHKTLIQGRQTRTGVTIVLPHGGNIFQDKVAAAIVVGNGFGKLLGVTQVRELGLLETPIALTNTLNSFLVADALVSHVLGMPGNENVRSVNPVVGECNDGRLNNIRVRAVNESHVREAIASARGGPVPEGSVGAGTGTLCLGWKGGIGTASRKLPKAQAEYTVGVLVQTNFGGQLRIGGAPVGRLLRRAQKKPEPPTVKKERGSCMIVVATDAPLDSRQLRRLATRALVGLTATGAPLTHGSGDYVIAFSTHPAVRSKYLASKSTENQRRLRDDRLNPLFIAVAEATEEAILNSLFKATSIEGHRGNRGKALPIKEAVDICKKRGVIKAK